MSFLVPLYLAGALAVAAPVLFHLIRRTPRGETRFSSLMFLAPSPPRITRRSRIEHWLLLVLRGLALALLAIAFARPFWRTPAQAQDADASVARVAIVIDTSASMRRGDLWTRAVTAVDEALAKARPLDQVGVYACDETLRPVASFDDLSQVPPPQRRAVVATRLKQLAPTWHGTHLGQGLLDAAALVSDSHDDTEERGRAARRIVLVSDMQAGGRLSILGDAAWPEDVRLELAPVKARESTNAGLWRLAAGAEADEPADQQPDDSDAAQQEQAQRARELRIRVANATDSQAEQFRLAWQGATASVQDASVDAYVPAGESRVIRVPRPAREIDAPRLVLTGDEQSFDNTLWFVPEDRRTLTVAYLGDDAADDPQALRYYLERALTADAQRTLQVKPLAEVNLTDDASEAPPLAIVTQTPTAEHAAALTSYAERGGTVLAVLTDAAAAAGVAPLLALEDLVAEEADVDGYAMLGEIDFDHPMFAGMAGPRFNDFTQIRFWHYRKLDLADAGDDLHIVARFETGDPAVIERRVGAGRVIVLTAGWQPSDGQLARSWKFLLMMSSLIDDGRGSRDFRTEYVVGERVPLPPRGELAADAAVTTPGGARIALAADAASFDAATEPGVYELAGVRGPIRFTVNLDPAESDTTPLPVETFEQLGLKLFGAADAPQDAERLQQLRDVELEGRQRMWQWLIVAAIGILVIETWLAGRLSQRTASAMAVG